MRTVRLFFLIAPILLAGCDHLSTWSPSIGLKSSDYNSQCWNMNPKLCDYLMAGPDRLGIAAEQFICRDDGTYEVNYSSHTYVTRSDSYWWEDTYGYNRDFDSHCRSSGRR